MIINQLVEISVRNNGLGMSAERLAKLFNGKRYTSRDTAGEKGNGLGLAMAKSLVEKNVGAIGAKNREGEDSVFYFTLPLLAKI